MFSLASKMHSLNLSIIKSLLPSKKRNLSHIFTLANTCCAAFVPNWQRRNILYSPPVVNQESEFETFIISKKLNDLTCADLNRY